MAVAVVLGSYAVFAGCGSEVRDCACTITVGEFSNTLGCGDEGCVGGLRFGCDDDLVVPLGSCLPPDLGADGGSCFLSQVACTPGAGACCGDSDLGISPTCDPVQHRCCVPTGSACTSSTECCEGHPCLAAAGGLRCAP